MAPEVWEHLSADERAYYDQAAHDATLRYGLAGRVHYVEAYEIGYLDHEQRVSHGEMEFVLESATPDMRYTPLVGRGYVTWYHREMRARRQGVEPEVALHH